MVNDVNVLKEKTECLDNLISVENEIVNIQSTGNSAYKGLRYDFRKGTTYNIHFKIVNGEIISTDNLKVYLNDYPSVKGKLVKISELSSSNVLVGYECSVSVTPTENYPYLLFRNNPFNGNIDIEVNISYVSDIGDILTKNDLINSSMKFEHSLINPYMVAMCEKNDYQNPVTLIHYSDIHNDEERINNVTKFMELYGTYIDDIIVTGDMCGSRYTDYNDLYNKPGRTTTLLAIGNHDVYDHNGDAESNGVNYDDKLYYATPTEKYNTFIKPNVANWGVVQPVNAESLGLCYYYKDYINTYGSNQSKLRIIVLDAMAYDSLQHNWLNDVLSNAITNGFTVVIAEHFPPTESKTGDYDLFDTGFSSKMNGMEMWYGVTFIGYEENGVSYKATDLVDTFINNGGEFACWLCGHLHYGQVGTLKSHPNQIFIAIEKANISDVWADTPRQVGDISEDLFNIVSFDTINKVIKVLRIGASYDKYMRSKKTLSIDYNNRKLISTN